ncbi:MAG: hypothetical protein D6791_16940 [Chloroflexi bacterium]|nr:MAG: hypothetical protein D6791_16940 [Chloroflexota bacterium]
MGVGVGVGVGVSVGVGVEVGVSVGVGVGVFVGGGAWSSTRCRSPFAVQMPSGLSKAGMPSIVKVMS